MKLCVLKWKVYSAVFGWWHHLSVQPITVCFSFSFCVCPLLWCAAWQEFCRIRYIVSCCLSSYFLPTPQPFIPISWHVGSWERSEFRGIGVSVYSVSHRHSGYFSCAFSKSDPEILHNTTPVHPLPNLNLSQTQNTKTPLDNNYIWFFLFFSEFDSMCILTKALSPPPAEELALRTTKWSMIKLRQ